MTREEKASFILANIDRRVCDDELSEALDMAIKALGQTSKYRKEAKRWKSKALEQRTKINPEGNVVYGRDGNKSEE